MKLFVQARFVVAALLPIFALPIHAAVDSVQLGRLVLGERFNGVTMEYLTYYNSGYPCTTGYHPGVDFKTRQSDSTSTQWPVYSPVAGTVTAVGGSYGTISVRLENSTDRMIFLHTSRQDVALGQSVHKGQQLGVTGQTSPTPVAPHLHVEVRSDSDNGACYFSRADHPGSNRHPGSLVTLDTLNKRGYMFNYLEAVLPFGARVAGQAVDDGYSNAFRYYTTNSWIWFYQGQLWAFGPVPWRNNVRDWMFFGNPDEVFDILFWAND